MDRINPLANPLFPASANSWGFMMEMFSVMQNMARVMEGNYILSGCETSGGTVGSGFVVIDGEILPFLAGVATEYVVIQEINSSVLDNGVTYSNVYTKRYAKFGTGTGQIAWSSFIRGIKRNYAQQSIVIPGEHDIDNSVGYVKILVGDTTINLPEASEINKGNVIKVLVDVDELGVIVNDDATQLFNHYSASPYSFLMEFKSDGSSWYKIDDIPTASSLFSGIVKFATPSQFDSAVSGLAASPSLISQRKPFRDYIVKTQDANVYSIPATTDVIHINYVDDYQDVTMPDPTTYKNRLVAIYGYHEIYNRDTDDYYPTYGWYNTGDGSSFEFSCWQSTGQRWIPVSVRTAILCPYLYINGIKTGEVLRNLLGEKRKTEERTDITEFLREGKNRITIKEEKEEVSYFDSVKIVVNGKTKKTFAKKAILNKGETLSEVIDISFDDKVEIVAEGYYDLSENKKKELWFGEPGVYDDKGKLIKTE